MLTFGSVCSGIEAASVAWKPLGWRASFVSEIEAFPRAVLAHHYPETPLHGDFTTIGAGEYRPIDLLVGGTPCQSFSVAGLRGGLADDRGNLALEYLRLADRLRPRWLVWENVPGVLSSNGGRDFGAILGGMVELGYGFAYRVLDAQFFGVAQRRRRVFVVGYLGDWRPPAAVLFERESLSGHPARRREAGKGFAAGASGGAEDGDLARSLRARSNASHREDSDTYVPLISPALKARDHKGPSSDGDGDGDGATLVATAFKSSHFTRGKDGAPSEIAPPLSADADKGDQDTLICFSSKDHGADAEVDMAPTLRAGGHHGSHANAGVPPAVAFSIMPMNSGKDFKGRETDIAQPVMAAGPAGGNQGGDYVVQPAIPLQEVGKRTGVSTTDVRAGLGVGEAADPMFTLQSGAQHGVGHGPSVRRLTPRECERLQGFPLMWKSLIISICFDRQSGSATAEISCRKWQGNAWPADAGVSVPTAPSAERRSPSGPASPDGLVLALVPTPSGAEEVATLSPKRWRSLASGAEPSGWSRPPIPHADIVPGLAAPWLELARSIRAGEGALPQSIRLSTPGENGARFAPLSGRGSADAASGATNARRKATSTTSAHGPNTPPEGLILATSLCSALSATAGFIPAPTSSEPFSISLIWADDYTLIPWRKGMAPDGPRYKALGNSMAVPVMAWIGRRIAMFEALSAREVA